MLNGSPSPSERVAACDRVRALIAEQGHIRVGLWIAGVRKGEPEPTLVIHADGTWTVE